MTDAERAEALALLEAPDVLDEVEEDLERLGILGEPEAKTLLYLVCTSRILDRPLAAVVRGKEGTGKTSLLKTVASLMPPEAFFEVDKVTRNVLYYAESGFLGHRIVILDSRVDGSAAESALRTLNERGRLSSLVTERDGDSRRPRATHLEVEGPIALVESNGEPAGSSPLWGRAHEVVLDDSSGQTRRVQELRGRPTRSRGRVGKEARRAIRRRHRNAQRLLEPLEVVIPFADRIAFPSSSPIFRRSHDRFLTLIELIALLHQRSRPPREGPDGTTRIEATPADYRRAYDLSAEAIRREAESMAGVSGEGRTLHRAIGRLVAERAEEGDVDRGDVSVTRRDVGEETGWSAWRVRKGLKELVEQGVLEAEGRKGSTYRYWLADGSGPAAEELELTHPSKIEEVTS